MVYLHINTSKKVFHLILKWKSSSFSSLPTRFCGKKEMNVDAQTASKRFKGREYLTNNLLLTLSIFSKEIVQYSNKFHSRSPRGNSHRTGVVIVTNPFFLISVPARIPVVIFWLIVLENYCKGV